MHGQSQTLDSLETDAAFLGELHDDALRPGSDVWSFGAVLFEMLSGKRLFSGETASDSIATLSDLLHRKVHPVR
jgi:serine/threonine protein kinase